MPTTCKFCQKSIKWKKDPQGNYSPLNLDDSPHNCRKETQPTSPHEIPKAPEDPYNTVTFVIQLKLPPGVTYNVTAGQTKPPTTQQPPQ